MRYLASLSLLVFVLSCNKDEIQPVEDYSVLSCDLCELADSIEGHYVGVVVESSFQSYDSVTFDVEHIFTNQSPSIDSTNMFFTVTMTTYETSGNVTVGQFNLPENDTVKITSADGWAINQEGYCVNNGTANFPNFVSQPTQKLQFIDGKLNYTFKNYIYCAESVLMDVSAIKQP
ncbi:MAG: hypothetical protein ACJASQ_003765 [Crocinitomicaceae bacterium]|jgi:hypothetical protein